MESYSREQTAPSALVRAWPGLAVGVLSIVIGVGAASGQDSDGTGAVARKLNTAEIEARTLRSRVAAENQKLDSYRVAALFGESDEERAARLQHEQAQDSSLAGMRQRLEDVEDSLRRITGQLEQVDHRIGELNRRIERMQKDFDYKLCTLAAQQLGASGGGEGDNALPCGGGSSAPASLGSRPPPPPSGEQSSVPRSAQEPIRLAPPPGVLGTLPADNAPGAPPPSAPASSANRAKYDAAMNLLARAQYDEARSAFRNFADTYPKDELTPQAVYWIGDIAYVQKDYPNAARAFAEEIKKYPSGPRAPESMLKLGQSLIAMGQKQEGCTTLAALPSKYPSASKTILARAAQERKGAGCRSTS